MEIAATIVVPVVVTLIASSGFWGFVLKQLSAKDSSNKLLLGLAHEKIVSQGMQYVDRGWVTKDEYDDFMSYLWKPYSEHGGNGMAEKVVRMVEELPIRSGSMVVDHKKQVRVYGA
jgi:hypothetical protein